MGAIVVVTVNPGEVRRKVSAALQASARLTGIYPEIHHANTTPSLYRRIARLDGSATRDGFRSV